MKEFRPFVDINELIAWIKGNEYVYYQAPMDARPHSVKIRQYTICNESFAHRATLWTAETKSFSVLLTDHFDRFRTAA